MSSPPSSAVVAPHGARRPGWRCRNCDAVADGAFCPACGQATALHPPTVREFAHEFLGHHVALEGPLWATLGALLVRPGRLTADYFAGRRQRYIAPLRLYLTFSLILFAVSGLQGGGLRLGDASLQFGMPKEGETRAVIAPRLDAKRVRGDGPVDRMLTRLAALTPEQRTERMNAGIRHLPSVLIVLVPVLALLLKGLYWNRRMLYGEHLVVAFHAQTVAFVFAIVSAIPMGEAIGSLWTFLLVVHGSIALRRVYGGRWIPTVLRELLLLLIYVVVVALSLAGLATLSLVA